MKALFGVWSEMKVADINRILKPHGVKLVSKGSKAWGKQVTVTAHPIGVAAKRTRAPKAGPTTAGPNAGPDPVVGVGAVGQG